MKRVRWMVLALVVVVALAFLGLGRLPGPGVAAADEEAAALYGGANCQPVWFVHCGTECQYPTGCLNNCRTPYGCCNAATGYTYANICGNARDPGTAGGLETACGGAAPGCGNVFMNYLAGCGS
jgi:hypothetical protein